MEEPMALAQAIFEEYWPRWQHHFSPEVRLRLGGVPLSALADCTPGMAGRYLSTAELERWTGLRLKKRSAEWLGGRLAAKWAAAGLLGETAMDWRTLVIHNEEDGRPYVAAEDARAVLPCISISHSGPMAAALAANLPCGLDIQEPGDKILRVKERFASPEEVDILRDSLPHSFSQTQQLTMLWAAKEAVRKMVQIAPLLGLLEIRLRAGQGGCGTPQEPLALSLASGREQDDCPAIISVLCFFADNLAWAIACPSAQKE
jgi:phosphopantetheinyl transferase